MSISVPDNFQMSKLPNHVAIIMDGNGRWARKKLMNRLRGHEKGAESVRTVVKACRKLGLSYLTLYAFSMENWGRPKVEIAALMTLLEKFIKTEEKEMMDNDIRLNAIGQLYRLPKNVRKSLERVMELTSNNNSMVLTLSLSYGSRTEILDMVTEIAVKVEEG